jgi:hypothetical protein
MNALRALALVAFLSFVLGIAEQPLSRREAPHGSTPPLPARHQSDTYLRVPNRAGATAAGRGLAETAPIPARERIDGVTHP